MNISRVLAYFFVAILGFVVGAGLFLLGKYVGDIIKKLIPNLIEAFKHPTLFGVVFSGIIGMVLAILLSYIWVSREQIY